MSREALLSIRDLEVEFHTDRGSLTAVRRVSFDVAPGEIVAVVGESGSGKSASAAAILGLLPRSGRVSRGTAMFDGVDLLSLSPRELQDLCGSEIGMIFQDPMTALNPLMRVGRQIAETLQRHGGRPTRRQVRERVYELLREVGIDDVEARARRYPHEFSGGMRQRVMVAIAMANTPKLLIADEPTTALDVVVQAQVLGLLRRVQRQHDLSVLLITHDLGVVAEMADRVVVMYGGRVVERADVRTVLSRPQHPYTRTLLSSVPRLDDVRPVLAGPADVMGADLHGCPFRSRCQVSRGRQECHVTPPLSPIGGEHDVACHFSDELATPEVGR